MLKQVPSSHSGHATCPLLLVAGVYFSGLIYADCLLSLTNRETLQSPSDSAAEGKSVRSSRAEW